MMIFSRTTAHVCHGKEVIANDLKHLKWNRFCFEGLPV